MNAAKSIRTTGQYAFTAEFRDEIFSYDTDDSGYYLIDTHTQGLMTGVGLDRPDYSPAGSCMRRPLCKPAQRVICIAA